MAGMFSVELFCSITEWRHHNGTRRELAQSACLVGACGEALHQVRPLRTHAKNATNWEPRAPSADRRKLGGRLRLPAPILPLPLTAIPWHPFPGTACNKWQQWGKDPRPRSIFAQTRSIFTPPPEYLHNTNARPPLGFFGAVVGGQCSLWSSGHLGLS